MKTNTALQTDLTTLITDPLNGQNTAANVRTIISDLIDSSVATVNSNTTVEGTDDTTTAYMDFGINVVITATNTDYCARLANPPVKGGTVNIINTSSRTITIFPSQIGGSINGVVDGSFIVPNDSKSYIFTCYENPLPGAWTVTAPAINQLVLPELSINHVNGIQDNYKGVYTLYPNSSIGAGSDGMGNIIAFPVDAWGHLNTISSSTKTKVYTNIIAGDCVGMLPLQCISIERQVQFLTAFNWSTSIGLIEHVKFGSVAGNPGTGQTYEAPAGTLNSPIEVGDTGTFYSESTNSLNYPNLGLSTGATYSGYYWTYAFVIPASAATKTYKFQIFVEYF